jgi:hypothetical protein
MDIMKNACVKLKISDDKYILAIKTDYVLEFLNRSVKDMEEMTESPTVMEEAIKQGLSIEFIAGMQAAAKLIHENFIAVVDKVNSDFMYSEVTPGSISKVNPDQI